MVTKKATPKKEQVRRSWTDIIEQEIRVYGNLVDGRHLFSTSLASPTGNKTKEGKKEYGEPVYIDVSFCKSLGEKTPGDNGPFKIICHSGFLTVYNKKNGTSKPVIRVSDWDYIEEDDEDELPL